MFGVGKNNTDIKSTYDVLYGFRLLNLQITDISTGINFNLIGGAGVTGLFIKDTIKGEKMYSALQVMFGFEISFKKLSLRFTRAPIISTDIYKFDSRKFSLGYGF